MFEIRLQLILEGYSPTKTGLLACLLSIPEERVRGLIKETIASTEELSTIEWQIIRSTINRLNQIYGPRRPAVEYIKASLMGALKQLGVKDHQIDIQRLNDLAEFLSDSWEATPLDEPEDKESGTFTQDEEIPPLQKHQASGYQTDPTWRERLAVSQKPRASTQAMPLQQ